MQRESDDRTDLLKTMQFVYRSWISPLIDSKMLSKLSVSPYCGCFKPAFVMFFMQLRGILSMGGVWVARMSFQIFETRVRTTCPSAHRQNQKSMPHRTKIFQTQKMGLIPYIVVGLLCYSFRCIETISIF